MMASYAYVRKTVTWQGQRYEVRGRTENEACDKLTDLIAALSLGKGSRGGGATVDQWYEQWKAAFKVPAGLTAKALRLYDEKYRGYIAPAIGQLPLREVRDLDLQWILNEQAGRSYSHVSKLRMVLQELFRQARRSRLIVYDPAEGLQLPETVKGSHRPLEPGERALLLATAEEHPAGLWVLTVLYTGMRPGETAALQWKDIDWDRNEIHVYKAVESGSTRIKPPKTAAGTRDIPIRRELRARLEAARGEPEALIFPTATGGPRTSAAFHRLWHSFRRAMEERSGAPVAEDLTPYCLRHTFCTDLQRAGVPINVAKELMGHANISVTANIYTHRDQQLLHDSMAKLDGGEKKLRKGSKRS